MKKIAHFAILLLVLHSCKEKSKEIEKTNSDSVELNVNVNNDKEIQEIDNSKIESDALEAAKNSLRFDEIQPLAAMSGKKEYTDELKKLNSEYKKIEDKYLNNKVEFTKLVRKYREKLQSN